MNRRLWCQGTAETSSSDASATAGCTFQHSAATLQFARRAFALHTIVPYEQAPVTALESRQAKGYTSARATRAAWRRAIGDEGLN